MNIFVIDNDPKLAAEQSCDSHVVKMGLESCQMLCSAWPLGKAPYKHTIAQFKHPAAIWCRRSIENYEWLISHADALFKEYTKRYGKIHKSEKVLDWVKEHYKELNLPNIGLTPHALCMPDDVKTNDTVQSYRNFYNKYKTFAVWKYTKKPEWYVKTSLVDMN